jgi:hypothetical protein
MGSRLLATSAVHSFAANAPSDERGSLTTPARGCVSFAYASGPAYGHQLNNEMSRDERGFACARNAKTRGSLATNAVGWSSRDLVETSARMELIRSRGHLPKGGYDVRNGRLTEPPVASALHG